MRTGGCQCGQLRYRCFAEPPAIYVCHCTTCRAQSSSAFGISFIVPSESFELTAGEPAFFEWVANSGTRVRGAFCANCGTRIWHEDAVGSTTHSIKAGSLDEPVDVSNAIHIWLASKLPGIAIPDGCPQFDGEPD